MFSNHVGLRDSNKAKVLAIFEAFCIFSHSFRGELILERDLLNAISWVNSSTLSPCKFQFF